jgi:hypothetical protein
LTTNPGSGLAASRPTSAPSAAPGPRPVIHRSIRFIANMPIMIAGGKPSTAATVDAVRFIQPPEKRPNP